MPYIFLRNSKVISKNKSVYACPFLRWTTFSNYLLAKKFHFVVVSSCLQASIRLQPGLAFVDYIQYSTIVIVELDLLRRLVCQTVTVAIPGFAKSGKAPYSSPEWTRVLGEQFCYREASETPVPGSGRLFLIRKTPNLCWFLFLGNQQTTPVQMHNWSQFAFSTVWPQRSSIGSVVGLVGHSKRWGLWNWLGQMLLLPLPILDK